MTHRRLTREERLVKNLLLSGHSASATAKLLGLSRRKVKRIIRDLVYFREIQHIPGTKSPAVYEDPNYNRFNPPTGDCPDDNTPLTPRVSDFDRGVVLPKYIEKDLDRLLELATRPHMHDDADAVFAEYGTSIASECPDGFVELHINGGQVKYKVEQRGDLEDLKDSQGCTIGYWSARGNARGQAESHTLHLRIFNQEVTAVFRVSTKGTMTFLLYLSRIFVDTRKFGSEEEYMDAFVDRGNIVAHLLMKHGWILTQPQVVGKLEYAIREHPLQEIFPEGSIPSDADFFIDTSFGVPEVEMKDVSETDKVDAWARAPTHILTLKARQEAMASEFLLMKEQLDGLLEITQRQNEIITNLVRSTTGLVTVGSNLTVSQAMSDTRSVETLYTSLDGKVPSGGSQKPHDKRREGYN